MSIFNGSLAVILLSLVAGASFVTQQAANASLRASIGSTAWAGLVSYAGGTVCMAVLALALRDPLPNSDAVCAAPWWSWTGGLLGTVYIAIAILLVPRIGAGLFLVLFITGQLLTGLGYDHFGLFHLAVRRLDLTHSIGAILLIAGAVLIGR